VVQPVGALDRVSVAVIVDGTYRNVEGEKGPEREYVPRTEEELRKLESIVKSAVNFDEARGDEIQVVNIPFETGAPGSEPGEPQAPGWSRRLVGWGEAAARYGVPLFALLLAFLFVIRPIVHWLTSASASDNALLQQLPKTVGELEKDFAQAGRSLPFRDRAVQLLSGDNDTSVQLMQNWMKQP
jgi:flagellar M-ring protein FliF